MVRTRRTNKGQKKNYAATFSLGSDEESGSEVEVDKVRDADADDDFDMEEGPEGSAEEEVDDGAANTPANEEEMHDKKEETADVSDGSSDEHSIDAAPIPKRKKLLKRAHVHQVQTYPSSTQTRTYLGPLQSHPRGINWLTLLYGPDPDHIQVIFSMVCKWFGNQVLPSDRVGENGVMSSPWLSEDFEDKLRQWSAEWQERCRASNLQRLQKIRPDHIDLFKPQMTELLCFLGRPSHQQQTRTHYSFGAAVTENGQLQERVGAARKNAAAAKGYLLDTGGIPLAIGWAPLTGSKEQYVAICSVPFSDQEPKDGSSPNDDPEEQKRGSVQIWSIPCHRAGGNDPILTQSLSFDWGRPKRLQWCPVPSADETSIGFVAILTADGIVRVVEVPRAISSRQESYEWVDSPMASLGITDEYGVKTTCLTWVNINRICLGHSDGSISLWSINPPQMLNRRSVHTTHIVDIASGFPSHPYHIATNPINGCTTLTDLSLPSAETTYTPIPNVSFQANLLDWNDHLQGFFAMHPTMSPQNTVVGWSHIQGFVQNRMLLTAASPPMCIASGKTHPFTLVGCSDGSLWSFNPMRVLMKQRKDEIHKLQIFQHEFRPVQKVPSLAADKHIRGAVRISEGFRPVFNNNARTDIQARLEDYQMRMKLKRPLNLRKPGKSRRKDGGGHENENEGDNGMRLSDEAALAKTVEVTRMVVHESRTRITVAAWNPNVEFGWWAAAGMGSGLVRIMDLGLAEKSRKR